MDKLSDSLIGKIQGKTGIIIITEALQPAIHEFINRRMKELNLSAESYSTRLEDDDTEMELLVNASTVNETYFFRDEAHYEFLQNNFFHQEACLPFTYGAERVQQEKNRFPSTPLQSRWE